MMQIVVAIAICMVSATAERPAEVEAAPPLAEAGRIIFDEENDALAPGDNTDRYYTQGLRLQTWWALAPEHRSSFFSLLEPLTHGPPDSAMVGITVGQSIYTPESFETRTIADLNGDRPFGGWAYLGAAALGQWPRSSQALSNRLLLELDIGAFGDWSLAGPLQVGMHRLLREANADCFDGEVPVQGCKPLDPPGWHHPEVVIKHGPALNLILKHEADISHLYLVPLPEVTSKVSLLTECAFGFVFDTCGVGVVGRAGYNLESLDAGVPGPIRVSAEKADGPNGGMRTFAAWVFLRGEGFAEGFNRFLDNDPFDATAVRTERNIVVGEFEGGAMARLLGIEGGYSVFMRTPELLHPPTGSGVQIVGRIRVGFSF